METDVAFGLDWPRSDAPLYQHDGFRWDGGQGGEFLRARVVSVDGELGGSVRILEWEKGEGLGRPPETRCNVSEGSNGSS